MTLGKLILVYLIILATHLIHKDGWIFWLDQSVIWGCCCLGNSLCGCGIKDNMPNATYEKRTDCFVEGGALDFSSNLRCHLVH